MRNTTPTTLDQRPNIRTLVELNDNELAAEVPAIFATTPAPDVSKRYTFVSTADVLPVLRSNGFVPTSATTRKKGTIHSQHRIELFRKDDLKALAAGNKADCPRIILENSHDRTRRLVFMAGYYRLVCSNGMVVPSGMHSELCHLHIKLDTAGVKEMMNGVTKMLDGAAQQVSLFKGKKLNKIEQATLANYAVEVRYRGYNKNKLEAKELLAVRRDSDKGDDLWTVFNRVQENVMVGGVPMITGRKSKGVTSYSIGMDVNKRLWAGAEALATGGIKGLQSLRKSMKRGNQD
ncbi:MAG: DUF945 domain-containing protein [Terrimicrobiaceae bacterium]|jgi:hypothetical protein|nr:DUF945 domain-containing protein [Terrimicrobiaceae bacterium]